jgi:hypothetical protein
LAADEPEVEEKAGSLQADARSDADLRASRRKADQEERARQVEQRVADENARRKAMRNKTARLRELRAARDAAEQKVVAVAPAPVKAPRGAAAKKQGKR